VAVVWNPNADGGTYWTYDDDPFTDPTAPLNSTTTTHFPHWSGDDDFTPGESRRRYVGMNYAGNALLVGDISYVGLYEQVEGPPVTSVSEVTMDDVFVFKFQSSNDVDYVMESTTGMTNWDSADFTITGDGTELMALDPTGTDTSKVYA